MAEIKSAIELAMERTKSLVMDDNERRLLAEKEMEQRVRGLVRRFIDGLTTKKDVRDDLDGLKGDPELKRSAFVTVIVGDLDIQKDNQLLFELFDVVEGAIGESMRRAFVALRGDFVEETERKRVLAADRILSLVGESGISGASLEPNLEAWDEWRETLDETCAAFRGRVDNWKEKVLQGNR